ncbi:dihydrolipoamide dehydrogenase [Desulfocicer vacuolatum DSM 3385]|uniref:Dihydrolipoamide dehydrogenase n=1 Tax=Desulfocicer vacuolatum DSM 3385 TaxID=1121400 RepID=A0A1W2EUJ1_9BACT|nr:dihydrolipoyl dehydrogenase [Desulfocicer vacuolatum]SMD13369.1 dihydrolipoamide dehydrogenase [Desulfocicer vacuolatum DSM 3385]
METREVEYAIIGVGTAGLGAFSRIRKQTDSLLLIQHGPYGTTCARVGCMPSKMLIAASDLAHAIEGGSFFGIDGNYQVNGKRLFERIQKDRAEKFVGGVLRYVDTIDNKFKVEGQARFLDSHTLDVDGRLRVKAEKIILACGSSPYVAPVFEPLLQDLDTSDTIFELDDLPRSMAVVGLGVIALEIGQAFHRLGVQTTLYGHTGRIGAFTHPDMQKDVMQTMQQELDIIPRGEFTRAVKVKDGFELTYLTTDGKEIIRSYERVLIASGRRSNLRTMDLEKSGLILDDRGLPQYDPLTMQCGNSHVFISGDATEDLPLWHEAYIEGRIAADSAVAFPAHKEGKRTPGIGIYFTDPQMACVGSVYSALDPEQIVMGQARMDSGPRHKIYNDLKGMMQVYVDKNSGILLGAEVFGRGAEHMAHTLVLAIEHGLTVGEILQMPVYHPTLEEVMKGALTMALFRLRKS